MKKDYLYIIVLAVGIVVGLLVGFSNKPAGNFDKLKKTNDSLKIEAAKREIQINYLRTVTDKLRFENDSLYSILKNSTENIITVINKSYEEKFRYIDTCGLGSQLLFYAKYIPEDSTNR